MSFAIVVIINKAFKLFKLVLVVYCDSSCLIYCPMKYGQTYTFVLRNSFHHPIFIQTINPTPIILPLKGPLFFLADAHLYFSFYPQHPRQLACHCHANVRNLQLMLNIIRSVEIRFRAHVSPLWLHQDK